MTNAEDFADMREAAFKVRRERNQNRLPDRQVVGEDATAAAAGHALELTRPVAA